MHLEHAMFVISGLQKERAAFDPDKENEVEIFFQFRKGPVLSLQF